MEQCIFPNEIICILLDYSCYNYDSWIVIRKVNSWFRSFCNSIENVNQNDSRFFRFALEFKWSDFCEQLLKRKVRTNFINDIFIELCKENNIQTMNYLESLITMSDSLVSINYSYKNWKCFKIACKLKDTTLLSKFITKFGNPFVDTNRDIYLKYIKYFVTNNLINHFEIFIKLKYCFYIEQDVAQSIIIACIDMDAYLPYFVDLSLEKMNIKQETYLYKISLEKNSLTMAKVILKSLLYNSYKFKISTKSITNLTFEYNFVEGIGLLCEYNCHQPNEMQLVKIISSNTNSNNMKIFDILTNKGIQIPEEIIYRIANQYKYLEFYVRQNRQTLTNQYIKEFEKSNFIILKKNMLWT